MLNPHIIRKTVNPVGAPPEAGIHWINTTTNEEFFSVGTTSSADWKARTALGSADALKTTGASVNVSLATPPTTGQVLTATNATNATWQTPAINPNSDIAFGIAWDGVTNVAPSKNSVYDKAILQDTISSNLNTLSGVAANSADLGIFTGTTIADSSTIKGALQSLETSVEIKANTSGTLAQFSATTSAGLAGIISDETGTGSLVFSNSPALITPNLGTPSTLVGTNITGTAAGLTAGNVTTNANLTGEVTSVGNATTVTNAAVIGKTITGFLSITGVIAGTDTILQAINKLDGNISNTVSGSGVINHTLLTNIGTNTHAQIDTAIAPLVNLTIAKNTSAPNATVPVISITALSSEIDIDAAMVPKGAGAFTLQIADNGTGGGNKRGPGAVDLQLSRNNATQVANGAQSFVAGLRNTASNSGSVAIGSTNISSGSFALALGSNNTASGSSSIATGMGASTFGVAGRRTHSSSFIGVTGDAQVSDFGLKNSTTNATPTVLTANASTAAVTNIVLLSNNNSMYFKGIIVAKQSGSTNAAAWTVEGFVTRGTTAASTTLVTSTVTAYSNAPVWTIPTVVADTTLGGLTFTVTGVAATNIRWSANIETTEIIYA